MEEITFEQFSQLRDAFEGGKVAKLSVGEFSGECLSSSVEITIPEPMRDAKPQPAEVTLTLKLLLLPKTA